MFIDESAKEKFSSKVLERVKKTNLSFIECILELTDKLNLEPVASGKLITKPIIEKVEQEAKNLNLIKKKKSLKLPVD